MPDETNNAPAPSETPEASKAPDASPSLTAEMDAEIEAAMADLEAAGAADPDPSAGKKAGIRGPRVVQGGREHRTGKIVSVGPTDVFVEFGPKELGVVDATQWKDGQTPPPVR